MNAKKLRKRFVRMGEDGIRAYLAAATPKLRQAQREVAAAESALHSLESARRAGDHASPIATPNAI